MIRKNILKAAIVTLIALALIFPVTAMDTKTPVSIISSNPSTTTRDIIFEDGFESYEDWLIEFPPWTCIDVNGDPTFGHSAYTWPHQYDPYAFIIFNPDTTTPPTTDPQMQPRTGDKYVAGFNDDNAGYTNDDWLITPQLTTGSYGEVIFWAHSYSAQYNLERFTVCVSTTDTDPASFTMISPDPYVIPPLEWTEYIYDISSYSGESIYIGIHMVSVDSWYLLIDDFQVTESPEDLTPPVTTATLEGDMSGDIYTSDVTVTLNATDIGSGVANTMFKIDDGSWNTYSAPFLVSGNGDHTIAFYSVDLAGNVETEKSVSFTINYPIEVTVKGGIGVSAVIKNTGTSTIKNVIWSISLEGGFLLKANQTSGKILQITAGSSTTQKLPVLGFGKTTITVVVNGVPTTKQGFILLFFVLGVK